MKSVVLALAATILLAAPGLVLAQDAGGPGTGPGAPDTAGAGAPVPGGPAAGGKGGKMKAAMQACRTEVQSQGLKGPDRKKAVMDCVAKEHPEMAGRMQCRQDGMAKGLSGDDLKTFVRSCVKGHA